MKKITNFIETKIEDIANVWFCLPLHFHHSLARSYLSYWRVLTSRISRWSWRSAWCVILYDDDAPPFQWNRNGGQNPRHAMHDRWSWAHTNRKLGLYNPKYHIHILSRDSLDTVKMKVFVTSAVKNWLEKRCLLWVHPINKVVTLCCNCVHWAQTQPLVILPWLSLQK
jgi:hypothetical protein